MKFQCYEKRSAEKEKGIIRKFKNAMSKSKVSAQTCHLEKECGQFMLLLLFGLDLLLFSLTFQTSFSASCDC